MKPQDAEAALAALVEIGLRPERPPEEWLFKAWDGDVMVDVIFHPAGLEIRVTWQLISGGVPQGEMEAVSTNQPDIGNLMRMTDVHYLFNWNTKLMSDPTATARIQARIVVTDQVISTDIGLKR